MTTYEVDAPFDGAPEAPAGLVLRHKDRENLRLIHTHNTGWITTEGGYHGEKDLIGSASEWIVEYVPEVLPDTLTRFVQRFRTTTLGASYANSISIEPVKRALDAIGCNAIEAPISPGMLCHAVDRDLLTELPDGTVLRHGVSHLWAGQAWYVVRGNQAEHLLGPLRNINHDLFAVHSIPDMSEPLPWITEPYDPSMQAEIDAFKDRAWELGGKAKSTHQWCGQYEVAMERMGLTQAWAERPRPMTEEALAALAENTIVIGVDPANPGHFTLWKRVISEDRGLVYVWGTVEDDYPAEGQPVANVGTATDSRINARLSTVEQIAALPIGSVVVNPGFGERTKLADGWSARPTQPTVDRLNDGQMVQYVPNTLLTIGSGVFRLGQEFETDDVLREPEGTHWIEANDNYTSWRLQVREGDGLRTIAEHNYSGALPTRLLAEPDEPIRLTHYRVLDGLPRGTEIGPRGPRGDDIYVKRSRGWALSRRNDPSMLNSDAFASAFSSGDWVIHTLGDVSNVDPRVGQAVTEAMIPDLPVGTVIYGSRSQRLYEVTPTGMNPQGAAPRYNKVWSEFSGAIRSGRLIIESVPTEQAGEQANADSPFTPGMRLGDAWQHRHDEIDAMPVGSQLLGLGSGLTYTRVVDGWTATTRTGVPVSGHVYPSCTNFTGHNCSVVRVGPEEEQPF